MTLTSPGGLSVVVVCWNGARDLARCLGALVASPPSRPYEIHFLDNASSDESLSLARAFEAAGSVPVEVHPLGENCGFGGAANEGARIGRFDYVLFLNTDVVAESGAPETLAAFLDAHPEASAVTGKLLGADGEPQRGFNVRRLPGFWSQCLELLLVHRLFPRNPVTRHQRMADFDYERVSEVEQPAGACLAVRQSVFRELGGFDERFHPAWFEDVDFCFRLHAAGHRVFFVPEARFDHRGGASLEHISPSQFLSIWYRNMLRYFEKHHGRVQTAVLRWLVGLGMLERITISAHSPVRRRAYWRVFREVFWSSLLS